MTITVIRGLLAYSLSLSYGAVAYAADVVSLENKSAMQIERSFGTQPISELAFQPLRLDPATSGQQLTYGDPGELLVARTSRFNPKPLKIGYPLIQTKGLVKGRNVLYISDVGKDATHNEKAKIWEFNPVSGKLTKFFEGELLVNSKWLFFLPGQNGANDRLLISDYGEESAPRSPGTGIGAKIFTIEINPDGTAGQTKVIYEGKPLRSPEGITLIGNTIVFADWAAGAETARNDAPEVKYMAGKVFSLPLDGSTPPSELFPEHKWVTVIGAGVYSREGRSYLRLIDLDSGRKDESDFAALPQSGISTFYKSEIISENPLKFGPLEEVSFFEENAISLMPSLENLSSVVVETSGGAIFVDGSDRRVYQKEQFAGKSIDFTAVSPAKDASIGLRISGFSDDGTQLGFQELSVKKSVEVAFGPMDPKNAVNAPGLDEMELDITVSACATSQSVFAFPTDGGEPGIIWKGAPLSQPIGIQYSFDGKKLWLTDQDAGPDGTSAIFEIIAPPPSELASMFPRS